MNILSLRQLAKELGVSEPFLSQIRTGKRPIPEALAAKARTLNAYHLLVTDKQIGMVGRMGEGVEKRDTSPLLAPAYGLRGQITAWSGRRESNPHSLLGRQGLCH